jgi:RNase H-fold protein (predicted Holliday junction resolvase)
VPRTAYVDESVRPSKGYMMCAVVVSQSDIGAVRKNLALEAHPYSTVHMKNRNDPERLRYSRLLAESPVEGFVISAPRSGRTERKTRDLLLQALAAHLMERAVDQMIIESCDQDLADRQALRRALGADPTMSYRHACKTELMLALPDILGWSYGRGGKFKQAIVPVLTDLRQLRA